MAAPEAGRSHLMCDVTYNQKCTVRTPSGTVAGFMTWVGTVHFVNDDKATGQFQVATDDGEGDVCSDTYDVTARPQ